MAFGWIKSLALPVVLLTLLAACQSGPNPRSQAWTSPQPLSYGGPYYGGCGYDRCTPRRICPPGHILVRIPYAYGGPGRYCKPYVRRCCAPRPPICGGYGPRPCGQGPVIY
ncbi:MAG: hypothetical protein ACR2RA_21130 [Geminicoccaceae bacterium]